MNRISVVIPAYNGEKYIEAAVQSALDQILIAPDGLPETFEVIVRDDGSTWAPRRPQLAPVFGEPVLVKRAAKQRETQLTPGSTSGENRMSRPIPVEVF